MPGTPEPLVVRTMREFKASLLAREQAQMQAMARRWLSVQESLQAQIEGLAQEMAEMRAQGIIPSAELVYRSERAKRLLVQGQAEFERYVRYAEQEIAGQQADLAQLGIEHGIQAIQVSYWPHIVAGFDRLPTAAMEYMVGMTGSGAPLGDLLKMRMIRDAMGNPLPGVWDALVNDLVRGTTLGWNPRKTARMMEGRLAGGLQKALVIARSEQLRVYRMAAAEQYRISGVVSGQRRLCAHDDRVCVGCLADEGTIYPVGTPMTDHPNGRCTGVPVVMGMPPVTWTGGETWLKQQDEGTQQQILGGERWELWQAGQVAFSRFTTPTYNPVWGGGVTPTPISELVG